MIAFEMVVNYIGISSSCKTYLMPILCCLVDADLRCATLKTGSNTSWLLSTTAIQASDGGVS